MRTEGLNDEKLFDNIRSFASKNIYDACQMKVYIIVYNASESSTKELFTLGKYLDLDQNLLKSIEKRINQYISWQ